MIATLLERGFTSTDWFQLLYPLLWFICAEQYGRRRACRGPRPEAPAVQVTLAAVLMTREPRAKRSSVAATRGTRNDGDWTLLALFAAILTAFGMAWAYLHGREVMLAIVGALLALVLGLIVGWIRGGIRSGRLGRDWWVACGARLVLWLGAIASGFALLHPRSAPAAYDEIFAAFAREGISLVDLFDGTVMFITYQAIAAFLLIIGAVALLYSIACVLAGQRLVSGGPVTWWTYSLGAGGKQRVIGALGASAIFIAMSFVMGSGYAYSWIDSKPSGSARIIAPSASLTQRTLAVNLVVDRLTTVRFTVQQRAGTKPLTRWAMRLHAGRHRVVRPLPGPQPDRVLLTLTPLDSESGVGVRRRLAVRTG